MDIVDRLDGAFASTGALISQVTPDKLGLPTPCAEWDMRALLNHTTGVVARFGSAASRAAPGGDGPTDWVGDDPGATFSDAAAATLAAWSQPQALDGSCRLPSGLEMPAHVMAGINFLDTLVHGWDVAVALGLDPTLDPVLAAAALEVAEMVVTDERRGPAAGFAAAVPVGDGASPSDHLVGFLGRRP